MSNIPQLTTQRVLRKELYIDTSINVRQTTDEAEEAKIKKLAESIKMQGVLHPPVLMRTSQAGKEYEKHGPYMLIAGFRRQAALDLLGQDEADYRLAPSTWTLREAMGANMVENLARENLTTFDVAMQCARLAEEYKMNGAEVAKLIRSYDSDPHGKKPMSESHVNNMIRCIRKLAPIILKAWKAEHPVATMSNLIKLSSHDDHAEQVEAWKYLTGEKKKEKEGGGKGEGEGNGQTTQRVRTTAIVGMIEAVRESEKDPDYKRGALDALAWVLGKKERIPGVKWEPGKPRGGVRKGALPKDGAEETEEEGAA